MLIVFLFGLAGLAVAHEQEQYIGYIWVPLVLVILSGGMVVGNFIRLIRYHTSR